MGDADNRIEVLKEIRDEIRGVRSELEQLRSLPPGARPECEQCGRLLAV